MIKAKKMEKLYLPEIREAKLVDSDFTDIAFNDSTTDEGSIIDVYKRQI